MSAPRPPARHKRDPGDVEFRPDSMPADAYISPAYFDLEEERLWARTWQIVCRAEEIPNVGDYVTHEIIDESIIVVRTAADAVKAFYNVCQHRGRRLKDGCGNTGKALICRFHGWTWNIDGSLKHVTDREDWSGCPHFDDQALSLKEVRVEQWGGWYWISMDPDIEPLLDYLAPVPEVFENYDLESMRFAWYKTLVTPCNWKVMIDAFNEGYHTEATHPQVGMRSMLGTLGAAHGKHSMFWFPSPEKARQQMALAPAGLDYRPIILGGLTDTRETLHALASDYRVAAAKRLMEEAPADAPLSEVLSKLEVLHREELEKAGAKWPDRLTAEDVARAGTDWHIFPNTIILPGVDSILWYRARPNGRSVDSCIFDVWNLERFGEGKAPPLKRDFYATTEEFSGQNAFLEQDFGNIAAVQRGMKSRGFTAARTNPVQEVPINNFHKTLYRYLATPPEEPPPKL
jgi:phenylpropionate dioxygenase-like ring-hydroxylating dioxygenase large terminal subunit